MSTKVNSLSLYESWGGMEHDSSFIGNFVDDKIHGYGVFRFVDGI